MKRSTVMLAGAATMVLAAGTTVASPAMAEPIPNAISYADLLEPVPDAMERLAVADASQPAAHVELAQYDQDYHHHHHHHHHHDRRDRGWYQSNGYSWYGGRWVMRHHHHHHHHHDHHHHQNSY